jgi:hypothetical protein
MKLEYAFNFFLNTKIKNQKSRVRILIISQIISRQDNLIMESLLSQCQDLYQNQILAMFIHHGYRVNLKLDYLLGTKSEYHSVFCLWQINKYGF